MHRTTAFFWLALLAGCTTPYPPLAESGAETHAETGPKSAMPLPSAAAMPAHPAPVTSTTPPEPPPEAAPTGPALRPYTELGADYDLSPPARVEAAKTHKLTTVKELFATAGVAWPPVELLLRSYKHERIVEVWATGEASAPLEHITTYTICAASGGLGPKRREGDRQVPEGYYGIEYFWPGSAWYLSMKINYPNASDRILGDKRWPGSDILIHGNCASIGCLSMSDERIEEIYVMAVAVTNRHAVHVHIYPAKDRATLKDLPIYERNEAFWDNLYEGDELFEKNHRIPTVKVSPNGHYLYTASP